LSWLLLNASIAACVAGVLSFWAANLMTTGSLSPPSFFEPFSALFSLLLPHAASSPNDSKTIISPKSRFFILLPPFEFFLLHGKMKSIPKILIF